MIDYEDKEQLQDDETIARKNKVTADDMNEIKSSVNNVYQQLGLNIDNWTSGTSYAVGDMVIESNLIYKCTIANQDTTFDSTKWEQVPLFKVS